MVNTILAKRINHIVAKGGQSCLAKGVKVAWLFQLIRNGENGYLVPQNDSNAMADKVLTLLEDENLKSKMETAAHAFASKYGYSSITKELAKIYGL